MFNIFYSIIRKFRGKNSVMNKLDILLLSLILIKLLISTSIFKVPNKFSKLKPQMALPKSL